MTFADISGGLSLFVDANTLVYHFAAAPGWGPPCRLLLERIDHAEIQGFVSTVR